MPSQVLWLLLLVVLVDSHLPLMASATFSGVAPPTSCPTTTWCGGVEIPFPFGLSDDCSRQGNFTLTCNHSFSPPRPYLFNLEVMNISLDAGEIRLFSPVSYICYNHSTNTTTESKGWVGWSLKFTNTPFLISPMSNVFTAIGCRTVAYIEGREDGSFLSGCITTCVSLDSAARDGDECTGLGCCRTDIPSNLTKIKVVWNPGNTPSNPSWNPCSYAFVAEKGWYHFKQQDLTGVGNNSFTSRVGNRTIPVVLDWAMRSAEDGSCQLPPEARATSAKPTAPACVSNNSYCVNVTPGPGYLCNCSEGYKGNPYITNGCENINECELSNPCGSNSKCHDTLGDYKCKCKFGYRAGKSDKECQPIFPAYATAILATFVAVVLACFAIILLQTREHRRLFKKNGGKILESHGITIYTRRELNKITKSYSKRLGGGHFGDVYEGIIDSAQPQQVAVKRSAATRVVSRWKKRIRDVVLQHEQKEDDVFVNEITFQFKIRHPNVVQLVGCCLETDIPILVFEYVPNGSLHDVLHGDKKKFTLSLPQRLDIAIGSAEALSHMHSHGEHKHVHGDVKPANILLDKDLKPKVSDFGSSKLLSKRYARGVSADWSYVDPVYFKTDRFTVKSDVYSFGVVLLELITGRTAKYDGNKSLVLEFVRCCKDQGSGRTMFDGEIFSGDDAQSQRYMDCLDRIGALAVRCLKEELEERPTMAEVVEELKEVKVTVFGSSCSEAS